MAMPMTQPMRTDDRPASVVDPALHVTLAPMDAGAEPDAEGMTRHGDHDVGPTDASADVGVDTSTTRGDASVPMPMPRGSAMPAPSGSSMPMPRPKPSPQPMPMPPMGHERPM